MLDISLLLLVRPKLDRDFFDGGLWITLVLGCIPAAPVPDDGYDPNVSNRGLLDGLNEPSVDV